MKRGKLKTYKVWYSDKSASKVRAFSAQSARQQAWSMLSGFRYGWSKADFMRNATVKRID